MPPTLCCLKIWMIWGRMSKLWVGKHVLLRVRLRCRSTHRMARSPSSSLSMRPTVTQQQNRQYTSLNLTKHTVDLKITPSPKILTLLLCLLRLQHFLRNLLISPLSVFRTDLHQHHLREDHEERLKEQCDLVLSKDEKIDSEYVGEEQDQTDIVGKGTYWFIGVDQPILHHVASHRRSCHT